MELGKIKQRQAQGEEEINNKVRKLKFFYSVMFSVVFFSLFKLQIFDHHFYREKMERQIFKKVIVKAERGKIYDRNGKILAMDVPYYSLYLDFWKIRDYEKNHPGYWKFLRKRVSEILNIPEEILERKAKKSSYPLIKKELTIEEYKRLKPFRGKGVVCEENFKRVYPYGKLACHVIGFSGTERKGLEGAEYYYDWILKPSDGISVILKDGMGRVIPSLEKEIVHPRKGKDIFLTIDLNIQNIVEEEIEKAWKELKPKSISVIVMEKSGEILALANRPNYDPNNPGDYPAGFRRNRAVTDLFEPGSIFKIVTIAAAIEENIVSPLQRFYCERGKWFIRSHYLHDTHKYEDLTVEEILIKSSNIGTVKIALKLGKELLYRYCEEFGFGQFTGIDLPGEVRGILREPEKWSGYSIVAIPIGQEIGVTAIQAIRAMGVIVNDGYLPAPHILKEIHSQDGKIIPYKNIKSRKVISKRTCRILSQILERVVSPEGTAPLAYISGYHVGGKTGTAQKVVNGRYSKDKVVASFVGYIYNRNSPKIVIMVKVDEPKKLFYGGLVAAPIFRNIAWRTMYYLEAPPDENLERLKLVLRGK